MKKDTIYQTNEGPVPFQFNEKVVCVFSDMIQRSIPNYVDNLKSIASIIGKYSKADSFCYDLGCSLGDLSFLLSKQEIGVEKIVAVDNSEAMINYAKIKSKDFILPIPIDFIKEDITNLKIENASSVVLNYTLQFIPQNERLILLKNIAKGLRKDGILLVAEKIKSNTEEGQKLYDELYTTFKKTKGYESSEINKKRRALDKVLISETIQEHQLRFKNAGFKNAQTWHQHYHFTSWIVWK